MLGPAVVGLVAHLVWHMAFSMGFAWTVNNQVFVHSSIIDYTMYTLLC